jgi:hypothetical protein
MKNILFLTATTALCALPSISPSSASVAPVATVTVPLDEVEIEYLPPVTVEVVHQEVVINGQSEG